MDMQKKARKKTAKKRQADSILLIGAGRMGSALLRGWADDDIRNVTVIEPKQTHSLRLLAKKNHLRLATKLSDLPSNARFSTVVFAIKPQVLKTEAASLKDVAKKATVISIAAGTSIKSLKKALGSKRIVRAMPNTPGQVRRGITGVYISSGAGPTDARRAKRLLSALGETVEVRNEDLIDSVTAVSGSGPAYVFHLVEALTESGISQGLPREQAEKFARATVIGAGELLRTQKVSAASLREAVTSPNGTTAAGLKELRKGMTPLIKRTVKAARKRAVELR